MSSSARRALALVLLAGVLGAAGGAWWLKRRSDRAFYDPHALLGRFPQSDSAVLSADVALLRRGGLFPAATAAPEPDYRKFVEGSGFDYRRDLDSVVAALGASGNYFIARGRFNWKKLREYAAAQGGSCYQDLCRLQGSTPQRRISFLPLRNDLIALAVSTDDLAATKLTKEGERVTAVIPQSPVWVSLPGTAMAQLPPAIATNFSALRNTERMLITFEPAGGELEARLEATCHTPVDAGVLASQLRLATSALKESLSGEQNRGDELVSALTSGTFNQSDRRVLGRWPVPKTLLGSLTAGI